MAPGKKKLMPEAAATDMQAARPGHADPEDIRRYRRQVRWDRARRVVMMTLSIVLCLIGWKLLSTYVFGPFLVPPPETVASTLLGMLVSGELARHTIASMQRVAVGFFLGCVAAITIGLLMGRQRLVSEIFDPGIEFLRFLSPTAMIPIAVIWFGIGEASKYFLIFWGTFFILIVNTIGGVARTSPLRINAAKCLGASELRIFTSIILPSAVPSIVTGMRVSIATAFISIIPAELVAADEGLGYLLQASSLLMQTDRIFAALVTIGVVGFITDRAFRIAVAALFRRYLIVI